jgi:hypothetical protein
MNNPNNIMHGEPYTVVVTEPEMHGGATFTGYVSRTSESGVRLRYVTVDGNTERSYMDFRWNEIYSVRRA